MANQDDPSNQEFTARTALAKALRAADDALMYWDQLQAVKRLGDDETLASGTLEASIAMQLSECNLLLDEFEKTYEQGDIPKVRLLSSYLMMLFKEARQARPLVDAMLAHLCFTRVRPGQFGPPVLPSELHFRTTAVPEGLVNHLQRIREIRRLIDKTWPEAMIPPNASDDPAVSEPRADPAPATLPRFRLGNFNETPVIDHEEQKLLTEEQFDVLLTIRNAGPAGIKLSDLIRVSKREGARQIVYHLLNGQSAWKTQVEPARIRGRPYRWIGNVETEWTPRA